VDDLRRAPVCRFGPDRRLTALSAVLAVAAIGFVLLSGDAAGRLLAAAAAVLLAAYAVTDIVFWPRLVATAEGLQIRTPAVRVSLPWPEVDAVRVDERSHLGLMSRTLEIEGGGHLVVLSRRSLGADPREVAALLSAFSR
jgi:Bacterial PH domain